MKLQIRFLYLARVRLKRFKDSIPVTSQGTSTQRVRRPTPVTGQVIFFLFQVRKFSLRKLLRDRHPDGIYKPIHLFITSQHGIYKPIPTITLLCERKFLGTLVFNHLPPSDYERHIGQSTSSGLRRLNMGSCCTPKFSLPFLYLLSVPAIK